jgi:hypothetical protein
MVAKCANPECGAPFLYLRQGKLFAIPRPALSVRATRLEYFWLCGNCSGTLTIDPLSETGVRSAPYPESRAAAEHPL